MPPKRKRELDIPGTSDFPGSTHGGLADPQWRACRSMLENVYRRREGNRDVAEIFCELPDKELYEDYYVAITEPECLDDIAVCLDVPSKLTGRKSWANKSMPRQKHFTGSCSWYFSTRSIVGISMPAQLIVDNEEGSQVWDDANILEVGSTRFPS